MKRFKLFLVILLLLGLFSVNLACGAGTQLGSGINTLARTIARQFGFTEARVAAVKGLQAYLNAGQNQYIREGAEYEIVAEGEPVVDPKTKKNLGFQETHVADLKITQVRSNISIGDISNQSGGKVEAGQKAIEKVRQVSIAVVEFEYLNSRDQITPRAAQEMMIVELIKTGRFVVADRDRTKQVVDYLRTSGNPGTVNFTKEVGKLLGVNYILYGCMTDFPGFTEIQCRVHDAVSGVGLAAANVQLTQK